MAENRIDLELVLDDKATPAATRAFGSIAAAARSTGSVIMGVFQRATSGITSFISKMTSIQGLLTMAAGGGFLYMLGNIFERLAGVSAPLAERLNGIKDAIGGFVEKLFTMIGSSPDLLRFLGDIEFKIREWTQNLSTYYADIHKWVSGGVDAVKSAVAAATATINRMVTILEEATGHIRSAYETLQFIKSGFGVPAAIGEAGAATTPMMYDEFGRPLSDFYKSGGSGEPVTGYEAGWNSGGEPKGSASSWEAQYPARPNTTINNYFNQSMTRSDLDNYIAELEREAFRNPPPAMEMPE